MAEYLVQDTTLTAIADAVRAKKGTTEPIALTNLATEIQSIQTSKGESKVALISGTQTKFYSIEKEDLAVGDEIRDYAFYNCKGMLKVDIPDNISAIGKSAFYGCENLVSVTLGKNVRFFRDSYTFTGCKRLVEVYDKSEGTIIRAPSILNTYRQEGGSKLSIESDNYIVYTDEDGKRLISYIGESEDLVIPNNIQIINTYALDGSYKIKRISFQENSSLINIGGSAFGNCINLESINNLPATLNVIGGSAFYYCKKLNNIVIPDSVVEIGESAFYKCISLTNITIPDNVTNIGSSAFDGCTNLSNITMKPQTPPTITSTTFPDTVQTYTVPAGCGEAYRTANVWANYAGKIVE